MKINLCFKENNFLLLKGINFLILKFYLQKKSQINSISYVN